MKTFQYLIVYLFALVSVSQTALAQSQESDTSFASHLNPTTAVVLRIDPGGMNFSGSLLQASGRNQATTELLGGLDADLKWLSEKLEDKPMFVLIDIPFSRAQPTVRMLFPKVDSKRQAELNNRLESMNLTKPVFGEQFGVVTLAGDQFSAGNGNAITSSTLPIHSEAFTTAMGKVSAFPLQIAIVPPDYMVQTYEELMVNLPEELGGGPITRVTEGFKWAAIGFSPEKVEASITVQSESAGAAEAFAALLPDLSMNVAKVFGGKRALNLQVVNAALIPLIKTTVEKDRIQISLKAADNATLAATTLVNIAESLLSPIMKRDVSNKLKQIGLAIHNYESTFGSLPPARNARSKDGPRNAGGEDGRSGLSWRVHILPFYGEIELYKKFKIDEPWDSENNKPLLSLMPDLFQTGTFSLSNPQSEVPAGYTTLVAPVGDGTILGGSKVMTFSRITDGLSNTAMVVEVRPEFAVPWTAPADYAFDPDSPAAGLLDKERLGFFMLLGDGSVARIPATTPTDTFLHLFEINDGNPVKY
jgi:hypothetical protein